MEKLSESELGKRLEALRQARESCEERKAWLSRIISSLREDLQDGLIDSRHYEEELARLPKSPQQIISECNDEIAAIEAGIASCKEELSRLNEEKKKDRRMIAAVLATLLLFSIGLPFLTIQLTGFVAKEDVKVYVQEINASFTEPQQYVLNISSINVTGELRSLSLSGKLVGEGNAKVYLQKGTARFLVFDTAALQEKGTKGFITITGRAVSDLAGTTNESDGKETEKEEEKEGKKEKKEEKNAGEENATAAVNKSEANTTLRLPEEQEELNLTLNETQANETATNETGVNETQTIVNETQLTPELPLPEIPAAVEKAINVSLAYKSGTVFDSNDDGVELDILAIDFTVETTNFSWPADQSKLCTRWVTHSIDNNTDGVACYGSLECCALVDLSSEQPSWNDAFEVFVGRFGATYNNTVSSQVIFANYSLEPGNVYSEIYYSSFATLPASFIEIPPLEENVTENVTPTNVTVIEFNNVCAETCSLAGVAGLNLSEYTLVVEVDNATLVLDNATYTLAETVEIDTEAPVVEILLPKNITYTDTLSANESRTTTPLKLNFTVSEPAAWIGYSLNGNDNVTITANTTIIAANGTNTLLLYAIDTAGNVGYAVAGFFVNITTQPLIDIEPPIITILSPQPNATYNATAVELNFTVNEPANVSYFLNFNNKTNISGSATLAASEGRNRLLLLAEDSAGNVGSASVVFFVNTSNTTVNVTGAEVNITPLLKAKKQHFKMDEDAELEFEYIQKKELVKVGKWKDGYEGYEDEDDYEEYLKTVSAAKKAAVEKEVKNEKEKVKRKQLEEWVTENETIEAVLHDAQGRETAIKPVIEGLRDGKFRISAPSAREIKPGLYTLEVELTKGNETYVQSQSFAWGLISLNTNKSIYKPGQSAELIVVVLDQYGRGVSNANITIALTEPDRSLTVMSSLNGQVAETSDSGVYTATYTPQLEGNYSVVASTVISEQPVQFDTYFLTLREYKYDIVRQTKSKIDPTREPEHAVVISVEDLQPQLSNATTTTVTIREFVPAVFSVTAAGAEITTVNDAKVISWTKELVGNKAAISYSYSVPKQWPRLYALGQAEITTTAATAAAAENAENNNAFTEARPWYVAVDPVGKRQQKTVEYFILMNWSQTTGTAATTPYRNYSQINVYIPENGALALKSAWVDLYFGTSGATVAGGQSGVWVNGTHAWAFGQGGADSGEYLLRNYLANVTSALVNAPNGFKTGLNVYNFSFNISLSATTGFISAPSAKLFLTYEYDDISQEQLQTVRRFVGMLNETKGANGLSSQSSVNFTFANMSNGMPQSAVIRDAWVEIYGVAGAETTVDELINVTLDNELQGNVPVLDLGTDGPASFRLLFKPSSFNPNLPHTLNFSRRGGGNVSGLGAEMVMTYSFDTAAGNGRLETMRYLIMQNGTSFAAVGGTSAREGVTVSLPQNSVKIQDAYVVVTGTMGVATTATTDATRRVNVSVSRPGVNNDNARQGFNLRHAAAGAAQNAMSFRLLYNASTLSGLANGNNVNCTVSVNASGLGSPGCELIVTFNYSYSDSTTLAKTVGFFADSSGAPAGSPRVVSTASVNLSANFTVDYPSDEGTVTLISPYLWFTAPLVHLANPATSLQNLSASKIQTLAFTNPDSEQLLAWGNYNATGMIGTAQKTFRFNMTTPTAASFNAWAWVTYSYPAPNLARIVDNSLSANASSVLEGGSINITGNYSNTGNSGSNWNLTLNYTDTTGATRIIDRTCASGDGFQVTGFAIFCNNTLANKGSCFESQNTGSVIANLTKDGDFMNITWVLKACTGAATNSPYTIATNATNVSTAAGSLLGLNASAFTKSVSITVTAPVAGDTTPPNNSIIVPAQNSNLSGSFLINASVNDSSNSVLQVNLTLRNSTGNATSFIPMNVSSGNLSSGYWNVTFDSTTMGDSRYNLSVNATDSAATPNTNISLNVSITIDNTKANVTIVAPVNGSTAGASLLINASVNDSLSKVLNATFRLTTASGSTLTSWIYASIGTGNIDQGYWNITFDTKTVPDDTYNITINATDFAGTQQLLNISQITIPLTTCVNLGTQNKAYLLGANVYTYGTCFNVTAANVSLDCQGYTIEYANASQGYGVNITGVNNTVIKNCVFAKLNQSVQSAAGIYVTKANNSVFLNNTINSSGNYSFGIQVIQSNFTNITLNALNTSGNFSYGIGLGISDSSNITQNIISTSFGRDAYGINLTSSLYNDIRVNNITTNGTNGTGLTSNAWGIYLTTSSNNSVVNNTVVTGGNNSQNYGIYMFSTSIGNRVEANNIRTNGTSNNYGIHLTSTVNNNTVANNTVTTGGSSSSNYGIYLLTAASGNVISGNTINTSGAAFSYGIILLSAANNNTVANNTVTTGGSGTSNFGIYLLTAASGNVISGNTINTSGTSFNVGIRLESRADNNTIASNFINTTAANSYGIQIISSNRSTIANNTIRTTGNLAFGLQIDSTGNPSNNTIYNNIFNTTARHVNISLNSSANNFSITTYSATNIIRGATIGGNFYDNSTAGGQPSYSLTCQDLNANGICDVLLNHSNEGTNNTDFYPLAAPDNTAPNNSIVTPIANSNISGSFLVNVSVNESRSNLFQVNLTIYNSTGNATGLIPMNISSGNLTSGYWNVTFDSTTMGDARYNLSINATDFRNNTNISANISITIDNTVANISAIAPANNTIQNGTMLINASVNDSMSRVLNATFRLTTASGSTLTNWIYASIGTGNIDQGYWNITFDTKTVTDGNYNVTVNATDFAGNQKLVNISQIEIDNIPNATIIVPAQNTNISGSFLINVSANSSNLAITTVNLTIYNNTGNATGMIPLNISSGSLTSGHWNATFDSTTLRDARYNLSVNVTTQGTNANISANVSITIDNTLANASIVTPANGTTQSGSILINASVNDSVTGVLNATFRVIKPGTITAWLFATLGANNISQGYWNTTFDTTTVGDGDYNITVNATDFAGNQLLLNISQITISNGANAVPVVFNDSIAINSSVTLTEGGRTEFTVRFNVTDTNGVADLVNAAAGVNITFNGVKRSNNSGKCETQDNGANTRLYTCKVVFNYYDNASSIWQINLTAADAAGAVGYNDSSNYGTAGGGGAAHNLTVNSLSAFSIVSSSIAASTSINSQNVELTFVVNNTGNFDFTLLNVTPYDLNASLTDFFKLEYNFSINATQSGSGLGRNLTNATPTNFSDSLLGGQLSATLPHKATPDQAGQTAESDNKANRTLYIYIDIPQNKGLSTGVTYNVSPSQPWQVILSTPS